MTTPQNPYQTPPQAPQDGQAPQGFGAPTAPPQGYPTAPPAQGFGGPNVPPQGYPTAPPAQGFAAPPAPPQVSVAKRGGRFAGALGMRLVVGIIVAVVIGGGSFIYDQMSHGADTAKVGDCMHNDGSESSPDLHVVSCSDSGAQYKVVEVKDGSDYNVCKGIPGVTTGYSQTGGRGTSAVVLCLGPVNG